EHTRHPLLAVRLALRHTAEPVVVGDRLAVGDDPHVDRATIAPLDHCGELTANHVLLDIGRECIRAARGCLRIPPHFDLAHLTLRSPTMPPAAAPASPSPP